MSSICHTLSGLISSNLIGLCVKTAPKILRIFVRLCTYTFYNLLKSTGLALGLIISSYNKVVKKSLKILPVTSGKKYLAAKANLFFSPSGLAEANFAVSSFNILAVNSGVTLSPVSLKTTPCLTHWYN
uniref:Putative uncharacterized protein YIR030W-A n=1 Tax=Saccharomyces cerevisiae (strain ATCC 204508 / S288c) TaxID=559292 RepID=YI30A_YEAST|nr:RecName: Full=Putative uncharacterized protein YIR030W-A [Saccharomyces cerevisiae S288C]AHX39322.1 hypothetical protein YIR030W-A [Saccharomyces cerevisiae]